MHIESHTISGIQFFDRPASCISHFQNKPWIKKILSLIQSFGTLFIYKINRLTRGVLTYPVTGNFSKRRLVVCIHGLNDQPSQFGKIVEEMRKKDLSETDILIPPVLEKGRAKLDQMVEPIFAEIAKWAETGGDKELVLVGISNGGRILRGIDAKLSEWKAIKQIRAVSIVGAAKGSSLADLANRVGLSWLMPKNISEEMPTDSDRTKKLHQDWTEGLKNSAIPREYTFIASPHDWQVPNYESTLSEVENQPARYAIVPGHGHSSIVDAVAKAVAEIVLTER